MFMWIVLLAVIVGCAYYIYCVVDNYKWNKIFKGIDQAKNWTWTKSLKELIKEIKEKLG